MSRMIFADLVVDDANPLHFGSNLVALGQDVLITVSANNVTIDFEEYIIAGGKTGIVILDGISGVTLRNGTVAMITGTAIVIGKNCSNITIEEMKFSQCGAGVLEVLGTSTAISSRDIIVQDCVIQSCCTSPSATAAISGNYVANLFLNDIRILNSGNNSATLSMIKFTNSNRCIFFVVGIAASTALNFTGFDFQNCETMLLKECRLANNIADSTSGLFTGLSFTGTCVNNLSSDVLILTNSTGGDFVGFNVDGTAESLTLGQSRIVGNYSRNGNMYAFRYKGYGTPSSNHSNAISDTIVFRNRTDGSSKIAAGIVIDDADKSIIADCKFDFQEASAGSAYGMLFTTTGGGGNDWVIQTSEFIKNIGDSDANSYGVSIDSGTNNLFTKNFAYDNGSLAANQMNGVSTGSVSQLTPDNLNNAQTPWANIVVNG